MNYLRLNLSYVVLYPLYLALGIGYVAVDPNNLQLLTTGHQLPKFRFHHGSMLNVVNTFSVNPWHYKSINLPCFIFIANLEWTLLFCCIAPEFCVWETTIIIIQFILFYSWVLQRLQVIAPFCPFKIHTWTLLHNGVKSFMHYRI